MAETKEEPPSPSDIAANIPAIVAGLPANETGVPVLSILYSSNVAVPLSIFQVVIFEYLLSVQIVPLIPTPIFIPVPPSLIILSYIRVYEALDPIKLTALTKGCLIRLDSTLLYLLFKAVLDVSILIASRVVLVIVFFSILVLAQSNKYMASCVEPDNHTSCI